MATQELKYIFKVDDEGKINVVNRRQWEHDMVKLFKGGQVVATFRKPKKIRSTKLNSFYWAILVPEVLEGLVGAGYERHLLSIETVHDFLVNKFLKMDIPSSEYSGEFITIVRRSKELSNGEWLDYVTDIERWSQDFLGITLSRPSEQKEMDLL